MTWEGSTQRWVLSIVLALLILLAVEAERVDELTLTVPVILTHLPAGLSAPGAPKSVRVTISGPRIVLARTRFAETECRLDLAGTDAGTVSFPSLEGALALDRELKVTRVYPGPLTIVLVCDRPH